MCTCVWQVFATDEHLVIVTDFATAGSLSSHIEAQGAIPEERAKDFFRQLADGMTYCHRYSQHCTFLNMTELLSCNFEEFNRVLGWVKLSVCKLHLWQGRVLVRGRAVKNVLQASAWVTVSSILRRRGILH